MSGKILIFVILIVMIKENAETNEEKLLSSWKINVSSVLKQKSNRKIDGKRYPIAEVTVINRASDIHKLANDLRKSRLFTKIRTSPTVTKLSQEALHHDQKNYTIYSVRTFLSNHLPSPSKNYVNSHESSIDNRSLSSATLLTAAGPNRNSTRNSLSSKSCYNIPVYMSSCPQGFGHCLHNGMNFCYTITENQEFPPPCPYSQFLNYYDIKDVLHKYFNKKYIWLHAFRNTSKFGFPQFEWIENGWYYGRTVTEKITNAEEAQGKNCLMLKGKTVARVSCSEKHYSLCMYSPERLQSSHLIDMCKRSEYDECIIADYDLEQAKCYCKRTIVSQPQKNDFCEKLAEPRQPFQTNLLINYLRLDSDMCWLGLHKSSAGLYKWSSTDEEVNYTSWAKPENCVYAEGAFKSGGAPYHGWALATDRTLKCAICEFKIHFEKSALELEFIPSRNEIELRIQHLLSISEPDGLGLYCFSDSNSEDFKQRVPIRQEFTAQVVKSQNNWTIMTIAVVAEHPSYYWCEAFEYSSRSIVRSNTVLAYRRNSYGGEFSMVASYIMQPLTDPFLDNKHIIICRKISRHIEEQYDILQLLRPMRAHFDEDTQLTEMLMHLTTKESSQSISEIHEKLLKVLESISTEDEQLKITNLLSSEVCILDITTTPDDHTLKWPETKIGATAIPWNTLCLDENRNMLPVTRKCEGDFLHGAKWAAPIGTCFKNTTYSQTTEKLFDLVHSNAPANEITNELVRMTQEKADNNPIDVHLVSVVLERLATEEEEVDNDNFSAVISNVMHFDKGILRDAQHLLNSTDKILSSLDHFMVNKNPLLLVSPRLIVQITDLQKFNVSGLALYAENSEVDDFKSYKIKQLCQNTSFDNLLQNENLDTAVLLSGKTLSDLRERFASEESIRLIIMIFYNDFLFNEQNNTNIVQQSKTKIISVSVPGFVGSLMFPMQMVFKMPKNYLNVKNCSHWDYGLDPFMVSTHGEWTSDDVSQKKTNLFETCEFSHMTHFGVLLQNDPKEAPYNEIVLDILTIIGSALSLIGIIPIFVTAMVFKSWRSRPGNVILINFCIAITIQIILLFSCNAVTKDGVACKIIGAGLHYMVLAEFCWMFVVALLQHRRFVMVFKPHEDTIIRKCLIVGWGFPLIPVVITISVSVQNYKMNSHGLCNVVGYYYIFGYMLPIILILCSNAFIFTKIIYSVSRQSTETCAQRSRNYKLEILLALFLFFALGITWIFGIIGALGGGVWATYIFCITATLRGLVLFLFFIAGNKETRLMWKKRTTYYMENKPRKPEGGASSNVTNVSSE